jgi:hypothetical protein
MLEADECADARNAVSGSSTRHKRSGAECDPRLLRVCERIAKALEQQVQVLSLVHQSNLELLDELLNGDGGDGQGQDAGTYMDGSPRDDG